jgi:hypothetical protein
MGLPPDSPGLVECDVSQPHQSTGVGLTASRFQSPFLWSSLLHTLMGASLMLVFAMQGVSAAFP